MAGRKKWWQRPRPQLAAAAHARAMRLEKALVACGKTIRIQWEVDNLHLNVLERKGGGERKEGGKQEGAEREGGEEKEGGVGPDRQEYALKMVRTNYILI